MLNNTHNHQITKEYNKKENNKNPIKDTKDNNKPLTVNKANGLNLKSKETKWLGSFKNK